MKAPTQRPAMPALRQPAVITPAQHYLPVTPWFSAGTPPARPGVYERQVRLAPYSYWDGARWGMSSQTIITAMLNRRLESLTQDARWRGLLLEISV